MDTLEAYGLFHYSPHDYFKEALSLIKSQKITDALQSMDASIVFSHNAPFYIYQKIRLLYELGAYKNCSQLIVSQLDYFYKHASLYLLCRCIKYFQEINHFEVDLLARLLKQHHVPYCLADCYEMLLTKKDKSFFQLAQKAKKQDDYPLCLCYCDLELKLHPHHAETYTLKIYALHILGQLMEAQKVSSVYQALVPTDPEGYASSALIYMELGRYNAAICDLQKALSLSPNHEDYLAFLAECYYLSKQYNEAVLIYQQLTAKQPDNLQYYFNLSHIYQKTRKKRLSKHYIKLIQKTLKRQRGIIPHE